MRLGVKILIALVGLLVLACPAGAYYDLGSRQGFVNDFAGVLTSEQRQSLEIKVRQIEQQTTNEIGVAIIPSLQGDAVENFANELFNKWGIGKKDKNNGILILVALEDKRVRIEVGYGLEPILTDAQSSWIINDQMKPAFRNNDYYGGINAAIDKIFGAMKGDVVPTASPADNFLGNEDLVYFLLVVGFIILNIISNVFGRLLGKTRSFWLGGVLGLGLGGVIGLFMASLAVAIGLGVGLGIFGLIYDYIVSRVVKKTNKKTNSFWWLTGGGFGGGSSGGFGGGGFGGGSSGGGGASGGW